MAVTVTIDLSSELERVTEDAAEQVIEDLEPPVSLVLLFENSLI